MSWQRNMAAIWTGQLLAMIGFSFSFAFIPLYIQELGITEQREVEMWAGLLGFAGGLSMAASAPVWGALADRYGRKPMLLRSLFSAAVLVAAMGLATNVHQLLVLRFLQGAVAGVMAASNSLVASITPREQLGFALGAMQTAMYTGFALGPLAGGFFADLVGFRPTFFVTSVLIGLGGAVVLFFVEEPFRRPPVGSRQRHLFAGMGRVAREPALLALVSTVFGIHASAMMVMPIFPLFVQSLVSSGRNVASTVGVILGVAGFAAAGAALVVGKMSDRLGHRRVLAICALGAGLSYLPQYFATDVTQVLVLRVLLGLFAGGMLPSANALIALRAPAAVQGAAFGLSSAASSIGGALGPLMGAGLATTVGLRFVFVVAGLLLIVTGIVAALIRPSAGQQAAAGPEIAADGGPPPGP